ncbi:MAG: sensor domain-containing diguanylate cyclase [Lachnospiraceae bacterium]|nr:sensor domain-containing diguanylate cyclase [Lachnospiraceae bacterium]
MEKNDTNISQQIKFSITNAIIAGLLFAFYAILFMFDRKVMLTTYVSGFSVIIMLLFDCLLARIKYFGKIFWSKIIKLLICSALSISIIYGYGYFYMSDSSDIRTMFCVRMLLVLLIIIYCVICVEYMFMFDITERFYQISAIAGMVIPINLVLFISYVIDEKVENYDILFVLIFITIVITIFYSVINHISEFLNAFYERLFKEERMAINSQEESKNLKLYQSKLVRANELLSKQKVQLESANKIITRSNTEMKMQHMLVKHINSELHTDKIIEFITEGMISELHVDLCSVIIRQLDNMETTDEVLCNAIATQDSKLSDDPTQSIRDSEFIKIYGMIPSATYIVDNKVPDSKYDFLIGSNIGSLLIYPMKVTDNITGVLIVGANAYGYFKDNIPFFETIVEQIVLALRNSFLYSQMQDMATKDALTSIYNRRYFNAVFPETLEKVVNENKDFTVVLFDIDRFKKVNDNYGHIFGDQVIKYCGKVAADYAKKYKGFAVRYGGEEFGITFYGKKIEEVQPIVMRMHEEIKAHRFDFDGKKIKINVSIGITSYPEICKDVNALLNRADNAMYSSKKNGRGMITIDSDELFEND